MGNQKIDFTTEYVERLSKAETKIKEIEHKTDNLSNIQETLAVLTSIQKDMIEDNKIRDKERRETTKGIAELSVAVQQMADAVSKLNAKIDANDKKLNTVITENNNAVENKKSRRAFWGAVITSILTSIGAIIVAILT